MKFKYIAFIGILITSHTIFSMGLFTSPEVYDPEKSRLKQKGFTDIGFELVNRTDREIWIAVVQQGIAGTVARPSVLAITPVSKGFPARITTSFDIMNSFDINYETILYVWNQRPEPAMRGASYDQLKEKITFRSMMGKQIPTVTSSVSPKFIVKFGPGTTLYLAWDGKGDRPLRPQIGMLKGLAKKTESNLSLKNNVNSFVTISPGQVSEYWKQQLKK